MPPSTWGKIEKTSVSWLLSSPDWPCALPHPLKRLGDFMLFLADWSNLPGLALPNQYPLLSTWPSQSPGFCWSGNRQPWANQRISCLSRASHHTVHRPRVQNRPEREVECLPIKVPAQELDDRAADTGFTTSQLWFLARDVTSLSPSYLICKTGLLWGDAKAFSMVSGMQ